MEGGINQDYVLNSRIYILFRHVELNEEMKQYDELEMEDKET